MSDGLFTELAVIADQRSILTDAATIAGRVVDWTGRFHGSSPALLRPGSTRELAAMLATCNRHHAAVVPQGGNTGLVGGATPLGGELLLSSEGLHGIDDVDADAGTLVARAGTPLATVQQAARTAGWEYAVDLAARDSATIGGTVATNAGGVHVIAHGDTRAQVLGVEAVLADGSLIGDLRGLRKDNTGYPLAALLTGSEGTLAVITRVCLRLVAPPAEVAVALVGYRSVADAVASAGQLRRTLADVRAIELMLDSGVDLVRDTFSLPEPLPAPWPALLLVEVAGAPGAIDRLSAAIERDGRVGDTAVADDSLRRHALWRYRESLPEAIARRGVPHKLDVTLPARALATFTDAVRADVVALRPHATVWLFGHVGDGNVHVNITGVATDDDMVDHLVLRLVASSGGSISAEHGIGRAKARWLSLNRTPAEIATMRGIKRALDPAGILNPGALLPPTDSPD